MNTALKWVLGILGAVALLLLIGFGVAALMPVEEDPPLDMSNHGAGSDSVEPAYSGLLREYPPTNEPDGQQATAAQVELGRQLFFDPALSENNDVSCATCHHPDLGFSDGLVTAAGHDGTPLDRNTPSLWNVAYAQNLFWDGRVSSLEEQVKVPLTHPNEMGVADWLRWWWNCATFPPMPMRLRQPMVRAMLFRLRTCRARWPHSSGR